MEADSGTFKWGVTTSQAYFPKDNSEYFDALTRTLLTGSANTRRMTKVKAFCAVS